MYQCVFLGMKSMLGLAYPGDLRTEISNQCHVLCDDIEGDEWQTHADALSRADIIFATWGMPALDCNFLEMAPNLKAVFYAAGTVKGFATPQSYERDVLISSAWAANAVPVAEYSVATILLSLKRFWSYARLAKETRLCERPLAVAGAYRSKVGLVSLGAIGKLVAKHLGSYELNLLAHDPFADPEIARDLAVSLVSLEEIFAVSDVVSLHTPWLPETEGLINGRLVSSMKQGATLINTSRGAVINEPELCAVLAERPDLTAILDVTWPEPPAKDSPFYTLPNVILTPHIAGSMDGEISRMGRYMVEEFSRYAQGQPLKHSVSPEMLKRMA